MTKLINTVVSGWSDSGIIRQTDEDVYMYGLEILIHTVLNFAVIMISAVLIGKLTESFFLMSVIMPLQVCGGGYHAKTHLRCFLIMYIGWWTVIYILPLISPVVSVVVVCVSVIVIYFIAPVSHVNVKMSDGRKLLMRKYVRIIAALTALNGAVLTLGQISRIGAVISAGMGVAAVSMLAAHVKNIFCNFSRK